MSADAAKAVDVVSQLADGSAAALPTAVAGLGAIGILGATLIATDPDRRYADVLTEDIRKCWIIQLFLATTLVLGSLVKRLMPRYVVMYVSVMQYNSCHLTSQKSSDRVGVTSRCHPTHGKSLLSYRTIRSEGNEHVMQAN
jgi:hypothetical protein